MNNHKNIVFLIFIGVFVTFISMGLFLYTTVVNDSNAKPRYQKEKFTNNKIPKNARPIAKPSKPPMPTVSVDEIINDIEGLNEDFPNELFDTFDKELEATNL